MTDGERPPGKRVQARTRLARVAVITAARELFLERGYGATTIEAISDAAGVPTATVYRLFASKHGILASLLDQAIGGDDTDIAVADRPGVRALLAERDPRALIAGFVGFSAQVNAAVAPVYRVLVSAAGNDADAAALLDSLAAQRQHGQRLIARALSRTGALRDGVRERDAADIVHALLSPELYRLLVIDRGWTAERWQAWLTTTLAEQLLTAEPAGDSRPGPRGDGAAPP